MKITKTKTIKKEVEITEKVICNVCGEEIKFDEDTLAILNDYIHIEESFGYFSEYFNDSDTVELDICEKCFYEFVKNLKIPAKITNWYKD